MLLAVVGCRIRPPRSCQTYILNLGLPKLTAARILPADGVPAERTSDTRALQHKAYLVLAAT